MKRGLLVALALVGVSAYAQDVIGRWEFNDNLVGTVGPDAQSIGLDLDGQGNVIVVPVSPVFANTLINGSMAKVAVLDGNTFFQISHTRSTGNGGGDYLNNYTLIMDVYFDAPLPGYISLYQTASTANKNDGDWFIRGDGGMGISGDYTDDGNPLRFVGSQWHRIAVANDPSRSFPPGSGNAGFFVYVDGQLQNQAQSPAGWGIDGRHSLYLSDGFLYLFADEDEETAPGYVNSAVLIDNMLTAKQMAAIGGPTAVGIPDPALKGTVTLSDYAGYVGSQLMAIEFYQPGTGTLVDSDVIPINTDGGYSYFSTLAGKFDVRVKIDGFLAKRFSNVTLPGTTGLDAALVNGDIDNDNVVTVFDYNALSDAFDTVEGDAAWNPAADLDGDGAVTVFDYNILSGNFDLSGDD